MPEARKQLLGGLTGRSILFVNPMHTHGVVGMTRQEAWPPIEGLADHATQERFVYDRRGRVGDVLIWDERATMHRGVMVTGQGNWERLHCRVAGAGGDKGTHA